MRTSSSPRSKKPLRCSASRTRIDGRQVNLELTAKGAAAQKDLAEAKHNWLARTFAQLDPRERETIFAAGAIIRRVVNPEQPS